ncbi:MAG: hypothetical protein WDM92_03420 [Caulobacteraceae bacterium]
MITGTVLAIFFVPMFFVLVRRVFHKRHAEADETPPDRPAEQEAGA